MNIKPQYGIFVTVQQPAWATEGEVIQNALEQIQVADRLGYEAAWVAEHNARTYGFVASTQVLLAAAATTTKNIKLGSAVTRLPLHQPTRVAEDFALLDHLSNGRVYFGFGRGYDDLEFASYGLDLRDRDGRYEEAQEIVMRLWRDGEVKFDGKYFQVPFGADQDAVEPFKLFPRPVQEPHPPVFVMVSQSDASLEWAARRGYNFILGMRPDWDHVKRKVDLYRRTMREAGFSYDQVDANVARAAQLKMVHLADTEQQAIDEYERGIMWFLDELQHRAAFGFADERQSYAQYRETGAVLVSSPEKLASELEKFRKYTGIGGLIPWFNPGAQPQDQVLHGMTLFAEKVIPVMEGA